MAFGNGNDEWKKRKHNGGGRKPRVEEQEVKAALESAKPEVDVLKKLGEAIDRREGWAIQLYLAYKWGKPVEKHEMTGEDGGAVLIRWLTDGEDGTDPV